ncbi:MAG: 30S ribosomal protein S19 [Candidatus Aenigmarchaeota archaeon]|nr:30S ribosomal protein S19 [Candidatus Aenigmarchaeota archaeon]
MPKIFTYRGKSVEQLKQMSIEEFSRLLTSRDRRAIKRGLTLPQKKLLEDIKKNPSDFHKTHVREMIILPQMIGSKIGVYTGKDWVQLNVTADMMGFRLGDFAPVNKRVKHSSPGVGATRGSKHIPLK